MKNGTIKTNKTRMIALILLLCTVTLMFSSCGSEKIEKPADANFEYWILDKPDMSNCTELYISGNKVHHYLDNGYKAEVSENGNLVAPKVAVIYCVHKYPFTDWGVVWRIDSIRVTDPNVSVWGLTINSTREEFVEVMIDLGFEFHSEGEKYICFSFDKNYVGLRYGERITISYDIPNIGSKIL